jgi:serine/threonine kinase 32
MIQRKTNNRLGTCGGMSEIKDHPWFKGFPWNELLKKKVNSPYTPRNTIGTEDYRKQISETS